MNPITQTIKEREEIFDKGIAFDESSVYSQNFKKAIQSHITQTNIALLESVAGVVERVEKKPSAKSLLVQDCPNCGQEVNREYVDNLTKDIKKEALQDILTELQEALKELKDNE